MELSAALAVFGLLVATALFSVEAKRPLLFSLSKPTATLSLLLVTGVPVNDRFAGLVAAGIAFSALGDVALLSERGEAFLVGLFLFLIAHLGYSAAFLGGGKAAPFWSSGLVGFVVIAVCSLVFLKMLWRDLQGSWRVPVTLYAAAITVMVGAAYLVLAGPWPLRVGHAAVAGALSFYVGDLLLAWCRFRAPFPHGQALSLSFYWLGQLGIALAARWGNVG